MRTEARLTLEDLLLSAGGFESREVAEGPRRDQCDGERDAGLRC